MKKWENIHVSFQRCEKKRKALKKSGGRRATYKTYVYGLQLQLKNIFQDSPSENSFAVNIEHNEDCGENIPTPVSNARLEEKKRNIQETWIAPTKKTLYNIN